VQKCENAKTTTLTNAKRNHNCNYKSNSNPILTATPINRNPNPSLADGGTAFLQRMLAMPTAVVWLISHQQILS